MNTHEQDPLQDVNKEEPENYLNTVTTIGPDSTRYKRNEVAPYLLRYILRSLYN
jgi:hypothetical protein